MGESDSAKVYKCERCGSESTVKEAFITRADSRGRVRSTLCLECKTKRESWLLIELYLMLPLLGLFFIFNRETYSIGQLYFQLFAGLLMTIPLIVLHELAHALAARLLGLRVFAIHLGAGRVLWVRRIGGIRWYIKPVPLVGITVIAGAEMPDYRKRIFLLHLAGPGFHAGLCALLWGLLALLPGLPPSGLLWQGLVVALWTNAALLIANLFPRKLASLGGISGTDGWAMIHILRADEEELQKRYAMYYMQESLDAADRGDLAAGRDWAEKGLARYPQDALMINLMGFIYTRLNEYAQAREVFLQVLEKIGTGDEIIKYMALNNVAFANLMLADPHLLGQAAEFSLQAYRNMPWEPSVTGTRGAALMLTGQVEEGIGLLKNAMTRNPDPYGKALDACFIALGELRRGSRAKAEKYLEAARRLEPKCPLLERTQAELAAAQ
jgi:tetratricopeptide (TPR) repeat protein